MKTLPEGHGVFQHLPFINRLHSTEEEVTNAAVDAVVRVEQYSVCSGQQNYEDLWPRFPYCTVDANLFGEQHYNRTLRAPTCHLLVAPVGGVVSSCPPCKTLGSALRKAHSRRLAAQNRQQPPIEGAAEVGVAGAPGNSAVPKSEEERRKCVPNKHLDREALLEKLKDLKAKCKKYARSAEHHQKRVEALVSKRGIVLEGGVSADLMAILDKADLSPLQKLTITEQVKSGTVKGSKGMRWHPHMIRFALPRIWFPTVAQ